MNPLNNDSSQVGLLGHQDEQNVLNCLHQTPLLEDFAIWSEWDSVFAPVYGKLKPFLKKYSSKQINQVNDHYQLNDLIAMETPSGKLLRITRITSLSQFLNCAKCCDVKGTVGHLISLVFHYGAVEKSPLSLLASHMKEAYLNLSVQNKNESDLFRFVIRCLCRVPSVLRHSLSMKVS